MTVTATLTLAPERRAVDAQHAVATPKPGEGGGALRVEAYDQRGGVLARVRVKG